MKKPLAVLLLFFFLSELLVGQSCPAGQTRIKIQIVPDSYPSEISWVLKDLSGVTALAGTSNSDSICVPSGNCYTFTIYDSYGDGICCTYGNGSYTVFVNGVAAATGGNYGSSESVDVNCPPGMSCTSAINVSTGNFTAPAPNSWYLFSPATSGMYEITSCYPGNCNSTIWIYAQCGGVVDQTNAGTIYYNDNNSTCGNMAVITAALTANTPYYVRVGGDTSCSGDSIQFAINYLGPITGCMDTAACNFNPLATVADSSCIYYPNPLCGGPDLEVSQSSFAGSLYLSTTTADACAVMEGCLNGYGNRTIINFTTEINNIGNEDYYIGNPTSNPSQFNTTNCHGHPHYEGYAEYVLYKQNGQSVPIGFKNGFCVIDLVCYTGTAQYGCSNMGITAGCGDIYSSGLACQWIDITDVDTGSYIMAIKVNWDQSPDALGRPEQTYTNNWAQVCVTITADQLGNKSFTVNSSCPPYVDCAGVPYGNAIIDCNGNCNGSAKRGDLNSNLQQEIADAQQYVSEILNNSIFPTQCNDLNDDTLITVWDAVLLENCVSHGGTDDLACIFPRGIKNPYQTVQLKIDSLNLPQGWLDIYMLAPQSDVTAYEFDMHGIDILNVVSLVNPNDYPGNPYYQAGGKKVIGISYIDSSITRSLSWQPLCRIFYSAITDTMICIEKIVDIVNSNHEATQKQISGSCWMYAGTVGTKESDLNNYFIVWPNPAKDELTISASFDDVCGTITISDVTGKMIYSQTSNLQENTIQIPVSDIETGIYTISIRTKTATRTKRLIIAR